MAQPWLWGLSMKKQAHIAPAGLVHQVGTPRYSQDITAANNVEIYQSFRQDLFPTSCSALHNTRKKTDKTMGFS